ncbi:acyl carrier protein [Ectothiorhodospira shaposhnikovii]|uniref:acyl carrier protein n=1 Tax=Ectothiorhodospira shaposhnikovii TaxID=1054 RepID=UPI001EE8045A|nr:acyl carrier protein [Ectothiorhodospira shaposhnikovii]MCG5512073.1 acyl carrier protein [Ectothiorhodospira shaposhnikovii]
MDTQKEVLAVIDEVLSLGGRAMTFDADSRLLGALPEFDSMAVVNLINGLETRFDFFITDDEIEGETFETVGSLVNFVEAKLADSA